jgi:hypothetical protein
MDNKRKVSGIVEADSFHVNSLLELGWELIQILWVDADTTYVLGWYGDGKPSYPEVACY